MEKGGLFYKDRNYRIPLVFGDNYKIVTVVYASYWLLACGYYFFLILILIPMHVYYG